MIVSNPWSTDQEVMEGVEALVRVSVTKLLFHDFFGEFLVCCEDVEETIFQDLQTQIS